MKFAGIRMGWGAALIVGAAAAVGAQEPARALADIEARFTPREPPVAMEYNVGYRFLALELARVGRIHMTTTVGDWRHAVTEQPVRSLFLDVRVDSPDSGRPGERRRVSLHDRMIAVLSVPDMQALLFAKYTDEYLNPLLGRSRVVLMDSRYDAQSGRLAFEQKDLLKGTVTTNLANPEALLELSRRIGPLMEFLVAQHAAPSEESALSDRARIGVNMDGKVVALRFKTYPEKSPVCLDSERLPSLCVTTVPERDSQVKPRDFHAWSLPFGELVATRNDPGLVEAKRRAPVESLVPLVIDYELGLGSVRCTLTDIRSGAEASTNALPLTVGAPPPAGDKG